MAAKTTPKADKPAETQDAPTGDQPDAKPTETKGKTFTEAAAEVIEQSPVGYVGTSPEAERTGRTDKGLSQQAPGILDGSSAAPDSRPHVDDSKALKALKAEDTETESKG